MRGLRETILFILDDGLEIKLVSLYKAVKLLIPGTTLGDIRGCICTLISAGLVELCGQRGENYIRMCQKKLEYKHGEYGV